MCALTTCTSNVANADTTDARRPSRSAPVRTTVVHDELAPLSKVKDRGTTCGDWPPRLSCGAAAQTVSACAAAPARFLDRSAAPLLDWLPRLQWLIGAGRAKGALPLAKALSLSGRRLLRPSVSHVDRIAAPHCQQGTVSPARPSKGLRAASQLSTTNFGAVLERRRVNDQVAWGDSTRTHSASFSAHRVF